MNDKPFFKFIFFSLTIFTIFIGAMAQGTPELLWSNVVAGQSGDSLNFKPTLLSYPVVGSKANGSAILICPGGGYYNLAYTYEGIDVAKKFNSYGFSCFVVKYRRAPGFSYPIPFDDARRAMRMIYARSKELKIDTNRIGIMGFSAGGHLAATVTSHFDLGNKQATDSVDRMSCRPAFSILLYPVISMKTDITHLDSRKNLLGQNPDTNLVNYLSNELQVTQSTPPAFLVATKDDNVVNYINSQRYYDACIKNKVPVKFMLFDHGPHGFGLADGNDQASNIPELSVWPDSCAKWLDLNGFLKAKTLSNKKISTKKKMNSQTKAYDFVGRKVIPPYSRFK